MTTQFRANTSDKKKLKLIEKLVEDKHISFLEGLTLLEETIITNTYPDYNNPYRYSTYTGTSTGDFNGPVQSTTGASQYAVGAEDKHSTL
jgi:hypothetical protein